MHDRNKKTRARDFTIGAVTALAISGCSMFVVAAMDEKVEPQRGAVITASQVPTYLDTDGKLKLDYKMDMFESRVNVNQGEMLSEEELRKLGILDPRFTENGRQLSMLWESKQGQLYFLFCKNHGGKLWCWR